MERLIDIAYHGRESVTGYPNAGACQGPAAKDTSCEGFRRGETRGSLLRLGAYIPEPRRLDP